MESTDKPDNYISTLARTALKINKDSERKVTTYLRRINSITYEKTPYDLNIEKEIDRECRREKKTVSFQTIITMLKKNRLDRHKDIRIVESFMCERYGFFKKLKEDSDIDKIDALILVLNLEIFNPGDRIINFGEEGDKFYIILQGKAGVYKPKMVECMMTLKEFVIYLHIIKFEEKNEFKLYRVEEANIRTANISLFRTVDYDHTKLMDLNLKKSYYIEEDIFLCDKKEGDEFGEVALRSKTPRTATIKALETCYIATLDKFDYNHILKKIDEKKFNLQVEEYRKSFRLIRTWNKTIIGKLINSLSKVSLMYGEVLYDQESKAEEIYFAMNGTYECTSWTSVSSFKQFESYILNTKGSLLNHVSQNSINLNDLENIKAGLRKNIKMFKLDRHESHVRLNVKPKTENLIDLKLREEKIKEGNEVFPVKIRVLELRDILGLEEALELKNRYMTVKCISQSADLYKMKLDDLIVIMNNFDIKISELVTYVNERKNILLKQLRNSIEVRVSSKNRMIEHQYNRFLLNLKDKEPVPSKLQKGISILNSESQNVPETKVKFVGTGLYSPKPVRSAPQYSIDFNENQNKKKQDVPPRQLSKQKEKEITLSPNFSQKSNTKKRASSMFKDLEQRYFQSKNMTGNDFFLSRENPINKLQSEIERVISPKTRYNNNRPINLKTFENNLINIERISYLGNTKRIIPSATLKKDVGLNTNFISQHLKTETSAKQSPIDEIKKNTKSFRTIIPLEIKMKNFTKIRKRQNKKLF